MTRRRKAPEPVPHDWRRIKVPLGVSAVAVASSIWFFLWLSATFVKAEEFRAYQKSVEQRIVESDIRKLNVELVRLRALCERPNPRCKPEDRAVLQQLNQDEGALRSQLNELRRVK